MSLTVAYIDYDDIVRRRHIDLGYFEEAKEFLESRPETDRSNIGILGISFGGMMALACASCIPGFKCVVSINGPVFAYIQTLKYKDRIWHPQSRNLDVMYEENGAFIEKYCFDEAYDIDSLGSSLIEFAECDMPFLLIFSDSDNIINTQKAVPFTKKLIQHGKGDYKIVVYPGAGHILDPPNYPHVRANYVKVTSRCQDWGGEPRQHVKAQEDSWSEILTFLNKNLSTTTSKL